MTDPQPDAVSRFLDDLATRGHDPLLHGATGTMRLELIDGGDTQRWTITVDKGDLRVSQRNTRPDAVMTMQRSLFEGMVKGRVNATAALLRGVLVVEGDLGLVTAFARLMPGPPRSVTTFLQRQKELADR